MLTDPKTLYGKEVTIPGWGAGKIVCVTVVDDTIRVVVSKQVNGCTHNKAITWQGYNNESNNL